MTFFTRTAVSSIALFAYLSTAAAYAQEQVTVASEEFRGTFKDELMSRGPLNRSTAVSDGTQENAMGFTPDLQISSPDGTTIVGVASISTSGPINPKLDRDGEQLRFKYGRRSFSAKLTVPFNDAEENPFFNFKNVGNDVEFEFDYSAYYVSGKAGSASDRLDVAVTKECLSKLPQDDDTKKTIDTALAARGSNLAAGLIWDALERSSLKETQFLKDAKFACQVGTENRFKNFERLTDNYTGGVTYFGLSGRAGLEKYELLDQTAFAIENENRVGFELEGYVGKINANGNAAIRFSGSFARGFDADDPMEVCQPAMSDMPNCLTGLLQPPEQQDKFFAALEGRLVLSRNEKGEPTMAIAPQITYDTAEDEFLVEVPIYLQRNKEGGLDAGIEFNYSSERDDFAVGFFVGVPLDNLF